MRNDISYFVFDTETVADPYLVAHLKYPDEKLEPQEAVLRWQEELQQKTGNNFIPYTFQIPTAVSIAKITEEYELLDIISLGESEFTPAEITERFWRGWEKYGRPTFVSFYGRAFDIPLLELAAFRYGLSLPGWFSPLGKTYDQPRNRYNQHSHIDLHEILTNFGATRFTGGLDLAANLIGKPGKTDFSGALVQELHLKNRFQEIEDACRCNTLDTYFVFLRTRVLMGLLTLQEEQKLVEKTKLWLETESAEVPVYAAYIKNWGDWQNPWIPKE